MSSQRERSGVVAFYVVSEIYYLFRGLISAKMLGWSAHSFLGQGSRILGTKGISVGKKIAIKNDAWIEAIFLYYQQSFNPSIKIGNNFIAGNRLHISSINKIEIGDDCLFGSNVYVNDHNHGSYKGGEQSSPLQAPIQRKLISFGPVIIGSNVWIGDNVTIIGPVNIGDGAVIGANSVVTRDVPCNVIVAGAPARILKQFNELNGRWEKCNE